MNKAVFTGTVTKYEHSHTIKGVKIYAGELEVPRRSGYKDIVPFHSWKTDIQIGSAYFIEGEVRTSRITDGYPKKKTYVKLKSIREIPATAVGLNEVTICGRIVGKNVIRQTPASHKTVIDFQLAVEEESGTVFPSFIAWEFTAKQVEAIPENAVITAIGQFHHREYRKDTGLYTIHEISCSKIEEAE